MYHVMKIQRGTFTLIPVPEGELPLLLLQQMVDGHILIQGGWYANPTDLSRSVVVIGREDVQGLPPTARLALATDGALDYTAPLYGPLIIVAEQRGQYHGLRPWETARLSIEPPDQDNPVSTVSYREDA